MPLIEVSSFGIPRETKKNLIIELAKKASEVMDIPLEFFTVIFRDIEGPECYVHAGRLVEEIYAERKEK